jgi:hypothetical protein
MNLYNLRLQKNGSGKFIKSKIAKNIKTMTL